MNKEVIPYPFSIFLRIYVRQKVDVFMFPGPSLRTVRAQFYHCVCMLNARLKIVNQPSIIFLMSLAVPLSCAVLSGRWLGILQRLRRDQII